MWRINETARKRKREIKSKYSKWIQINSIGYRDTITLQKTCNQLKCFILKCFKIHHAKDTDQENLFFLFWEAEKNTSFVFYCDVNSWLEQIPFILEEQRM